MIALIDYGAGNLHSVARALENLGTTATIVTRPEQLMDADQVIFPGVGAAGSAMERLKSTGFDDAIWETVQKGTPFLGICLGMQLLFETSEEDGGTACLGILQGTVKRFQLPPEFKVPHMGWNVVEGGLSNFKMQNSTFKFDDRQWFYFVHSYHCVPTHTAIVTGITDHGGEFVSAVQQDNIHAVQFHPEKSGAAGRALLKRFLEL